jgi:hypothetical protein
VIYAFNIWRAELDRYAADISSSIDNLNAARIMEEDCKSLKVRAEISKLHFKANDLLFKSFFLAAFAMRKMDDAAKTPFPANKMPATKVDRQLNKPLSEFSFDWYIGREVEKDGTRSISVDHSENIDGRKLTNLAIHSESMRDFSPPDTDPGFWIRSDKYPQKSDDKIYMFVDLSEFSDMLDDFRKSPWKD